MHAVRDGAFNETVVVCWQANDLTLKWWKGQARAKDQKTWDEKISGSFEIVDGGLPHMVSHGLRLVSACLTKFKRAAFIPPCKHTVWTVSAYSSWDKLSSQAADYIEGRGVPVFDVSRKFSALPRGTAFILR